MFYNLDGIPTSQPRVDKYWFYEFNNQIFLKDSDVTHDIDLSCVRLHDLIAEKIFGDIQHYYALLPNIPMWMVYGGIDAEVKISKEIFEKLITINGESEVFNKILYLYDCRNLISTLQNSVIETKYLLCQFYKILNENNFLIHSKPINSSGIQFASGPIIINIISIVNSFFVTIYSQLDFITKICYEFQNLASDFSKYPKLRSAKIVFGDNKKLLVSGIENSVYENNEIVNKIITLRNEIVHNNSFDNLPKVYQVFKNNQLVEKYILLPDFENGIIKSYKNRKRFFDDNIKLNEIMPSITIDFWKRLKVTLDSIR